MVEIEEKPVLLKNLNPIRDQVLVRRDKTKDMSEGGIHLPDNSKEKPRKGVVLKSGPGFFNVEKNCFVENSVKEGDQIYFTLYGHQEIDVEGEKLLLIKDQNIMCVIGEV